MMDIEKFIKKNWKLILLFGMLFLMNSVQEERTMQGSRGIALTWTIGMGLLTLGGLLYGGEGFRKLIVLIAVIAFAPVWLPALFSFGILGIFGNKFVLFVVMGIFMLLMFKIFTSSRSSY
jgi:hypothetical protein